MSVAKRVSEEMGVELGDEVRPTHRPPKESRITFPPIPGPCHACDGDGGALDSTE